MWVVGALRGGVSGVVEKCVEEVANGVTRREVDVVRGGDLCDVGLRMDEM